MGIEYKNLNGITLVLPARPSFVCTLVGLNLPEISSEEIDDTDLSSTIKRSFAGKVIDAGELGLTIRYVPSLIIPLAQPDELFRILFPLAPGQTVNGKYEFFAHFTKQSLPKAGNSDRSTMDLSAQVNTLPSWTEGS